MVKDTLEARRRRWHAVMAKEPEQKRLKEIEARECALQRKEALEVNLLKQKELQIAARKAAREATLRRREALKLQASAVMAKERELKEYDNTHTHTSPKEGTIGGGDPIEGTSAEGTNGRVCSEGGGCSSTKGKRQLMLRNVSRR